MEFCNLLVANSPFHLQNTCNPHEFSMEKRFHWIQLSPDEWHCLHTLPSPPFLCVTHTWSWNLSPISQHIGWKEYSRYKFCTLLVFLKYPFLVSILFCQLLLGAGKEKVENSFCTLWLFPNSLALTCFSFFLLSRQEIVLISASCDGPEVFFSFSDNKGKNSLIYRKKKSQMSQVVRTSEVGEYPMFYSH